MAVHGVSAHSIPHGITKHLNTATRGSRKEFPAVAVIVAESNQVTIYDGDDPDLPMWMVFNTNTVSGTPTTYSFIVTGSITSLAAKDGLLSIGRVTYVGVDFVGDRAAYHNDTTASNYGNANIAQRNNSLVHTSGTSHLSTSALVEQNVNDVAMTVLPNAPIDAATGLPVPTIAVATDGGASVISDDGSVYDGGTLIAYDGCAFNEDNDLFFMTGIATVHQIRYSRNGAYSTDGFTQSSYRSDISPALLNNQNSADITAGDYLALGQDEGLNLIAEDTSTPANGMVAYTTSDYATGWMNGDIKLATLSDTDATNVTGSELVTNGTFDTDVSSWSAFQFSTTNTTISHDTGGDGGRMLVTTTAWYAGATQTITGLTAGETYTATANFVAGTHSQFYLQAVNTSTGSAYASFSGTYSDSNQSITFTLASDQTSVEIRVRGTNGTGTFYVDNVTLRLAEEDRSVNGNGLQVFGTVTKSAVNTGADLVGYSGFSGSTNLLETALSDDFAVGTGDFCTFLWAKFTGTGNQNLITVWDADAGTGAGYTEYFQITSPSSGQILIATNSDGSSTTSASYNDGNWHQIMILRRNSVLKAYIDGKEALSMASTRNFANPLRITLGAFSTQALQGSIALFRFSKTAPSPEQIRKIYEDEKVLFQEGAQATLYGSSDAVTALAYDDSTRVASCRYKRRTFSLPRIASSRQHNNRCRCCNQCI
jgi:hypothetical protein